MDIIKTNKTHEHIGDITYYTIVNDSGASVTISTLDASITSIIVPDKDGRLAEIVISKDTASHTMSSPWSAVIAAVDSIKLTKVEDTYYNGINGQVTVDIEIRWTQDNTLEMYYSYESDGPAVLNLTNHTRFNLEGQNGNLTDQYLWLNATECIKTDTHDQPTGEIASVKNSPEDFTTAKKISLDIDAWYIVNDWEEDLMNEIAVLASHTTGRELHIYSTEPTVKVITNMAETEGHSQQQGIALECQGYPSITGNKKIAPRVLEPGVKYNQLIYLEFKS